MSAAVGVKSLDKDDDVLTVGMNRALALLADAVPRARLGAPHDKETEPVLVRKGRFGPMPSTARRSPTCRAMSPWRT